MNDVNIESPQERRLRLHRERQKRYREKNLPICRERNAVWAARSRANETEDEAARRRRLNAERNARFRASLSPEELNRRRFINAERYARTRANMSPEELAHRRRVNAERMAAMRANLTPEEIERRRRENAERMARIRTGLRLQKLYSNFEHSCFQDIYLKKEINEESPTMLEHLNGFKSFHNGSSHCNLNSSSGVSTLSKNVTYIKEEKEDESSQEIEVESDIETKYHSERESIRIYRELVERYKKDADITESTEFEDKK